MEITECYRCGDPSTPLANMYDCRKCEEKFCMFCTTSHHQSCKAGKTSVCITCNETLEQAGVHECKDCKKIFCFTCIKVISVHYDGLKLCERCDVKRRIKPAEPITNCHTCDRKIIDHYRFMCLVCRRIFCKDCSVRAGSGVYYCNGCIEDVAERAKKEKEAGNKADSVTP